MALIIVGLGNPGKEYEKTRHNAGRMAVKLLAKKENFEEFNFNKKANALVTKGTITNQNVTLMLPETMMNLSGKAVANLVKSPKAAKKMLIVQDDLDLPLGVIKMVVGRGSGGHKGIESIMRAVKTKDFARIRIGVATMGKKNQAKKIKDEEKLIKYIIGKFKTTEEATLKKTLKKSVEAIQIFVAEGVEVATMFANTR